MNGSPAREGHSSFYCAFSGHRHTFHQPGGRTGMRGREQTMHRVRSSTTTAVRTPRRLRSLWRWPVGAVAGLGLATTLALLPRGPAFGAGIPRPDPPLQAHVASLTREGKQVLSDQPADYIPATI